MTTKLAELLSSLDIPTHEAAKLEGKERPFSPVPITLMRDDTPPHEYIVHIHIHECLGCASQRSYSAVYASRWIRSSMGKPFRHMNPIEEFHYDAPVVVERVGTKYSPCCEECVGSVDLRIFPNAAKAREAIAAQLREATEKLKPKPGATAYVVGADDPEAKKKTPAKPPRPINDILDDILSGDL